jgi:DNA-binding PadR family transcriptional regulator
MGNRDYLGEFELVVMLTLLRLGDEAYGMTIRVEIEERTGRPVSIGAVYTTLRRLERKGLVTSELGEPSPSRGGRAKKFFKLEPAGLEALERSRAMFARLWEGVPERLASQAE